MKPLPVAPSMPWHPPNRRVVALTPRDFRLLSDLYRHGPLTTEQVRRLHFPSLRRAQRRLSQLVQAGFLVAEPLSIAPLRTLAYGLTHTGLRWVGADHSPRRGLSAAFLPIHTFEVNEFFTRYATAIGANRLVRFVPARECRVLLSEGHPPVYLEPDGFGEVQTAEATIAFFLEWDRGTESATVFARKFTRYLFYWRSDDWRFSHSTFPPIIIVVPDQRREALLSAVVARAFAEVEDQAPIRVVLVERRLALASDRNIDWVWRQLGAKQTLDPTHHVPALRLGSVLP